MKIFSICGVDGSGKTTLVKNLAASSLPLTTLRCPQYFESGSHHFDSLARTFEEWSQACDQLQNPPLKAMVLFLQISLFGMMEQDQMKSSPDARALIRERDPVLDTLVYAPLYVHVLGAHRTQFPEEWARNVDAIQYLKGFQDRVPLIGSVVNFENLRDYILAFFSQPATELPKNCLKLFQASIASHVVILKMDSELLEERLRLKHSSRSGVKEYHEESGLLQKLQGGLEVAAKQGAAIFGLQVHILDLNRSNQNQVQVNLEKIIQSAL